MGSQTTCELSETSIQCTATGILWHQLPFAVQTHEITRFRQHSQAATIRAAIGIYTSNETFKRSIPSSVLMVGW